MKVRKNRVYLFLSLLVAAALLAAAVVGYTASKQSIKIGFVGSLSAFNSDLGVAGRNGALLAVRHINENGGVLGKQLLLVAKDDYNDPRRALEADQDFQREGIRLIVGHMTSQMTPEAVPYINAQHLLMMSPTISLDTLSGKDDYFFRVIPSNRAQAKALCDRMIAEGVRRVCVAVDQTNLLFTGTLADFFVRAFRDAGGQVLLRSEFVPVKLQDDDVKNMMAMQPQGVLVIAAAEGIALYAQKMYRLDLHAKLYGPACAISSTLTEHGGKSLEGAQFVDFFNYDSQAADYVRFRQEYEEAYGVEPGATSCLSYESVWVLAQAMESCGSTDPDALHRTLNAAKSFRGLDTPLQFNGFGDVDREVFIYQIKDQKYQIVR